MAIGLLLIPALLLLYQVVRLGSSGRERRLAALRVAGATPAEVGRVGAVEVGLPVGAGAVIGLAVYLALRGMFGGIPNDASTPVRAPFGISLVPTTVAPAWWQTLLVLGGVTACGLLAGWWAGRRSARDPLRVSRRVVRAPRPWGAALLGVAVVIAFTLPRFPAFGAQALLMLAVVLFVLGTVGLASWTAYTVGRLAARHATGAATLLAARRLVSDPRPTGRAAAAIGGICMAAAASAEFYAGAREARPDTPFFAVSFVLLSVALSLALVVTTGTLVVHQVETLAEQRRPLAALKAAGTPMDVLDRAQRRQLVLVCLPAAVGGFLLGTLIQPGPLTTPAAGLAAALGLPFLVLVMASVWLAGRIMRPALVRATNPVHLRTE